MDDLIHSKVDIEETLESVRKGWHCCCCDLPVLRRDGPCPKRNPERYSKEAVAIILKLAELVDGKKE